MKKISLFVLLFWLTSAVGQNEILWNVPVEDGNMLVLGKKGTKKEIVYRIEMHYLDKKTDTVWVSELENGSYFHRNYFEAEKGKCSFISSYNFLFYIYRTSEMQWKQHEYFIFDLTLGDPPLIKPLNTNMWSVEDKEYPNEKNEYYYYIYFIRENGYLELFQFKSSRYSKMPQQVAKYKKQREEYQKTQEAKQKYKRISK